MCGVSSLRAVTLSWVVEKHLQGDSKEKLIRQKIQGRSFQAETEDQYGLKHNKQGVSKIEMSLDKQIKLCKALQAMAMHLDFISKSNKEPMEDFVYRVHDPICGFKGHSG